MEIGYRVGKHLKPGDTVCLCGDLGTGKTVLAKGIARAFGIGERDITSASFTVIAHYPTHPPFTHVDLYRIEDADELTEIGFSEAIGGDGIAVIEWAEKARALLPEDVIMIRLRTIGEHEREITVESLDEEDRDHIQDR